MTMKDCFKSFSPFFRLPVSMFFVAITYYCGAKFGLILSFKPDYIAALWPPNAILLSTLLLTKPKAWPWFLLAIVPAELAADLPSGISINMALGFVGADWIEVLTAAVLLRRFSRVPPDFKTLKQTFTYIICVVLIAPFVAAFPGAVVTGIGQAGPDYITRWSRWFISDALTHLLMTPFILLWLSWKFKGFQSRPLRYYLEILALTVTLGLLTIYTFSGKVLDIETFPAIIYTPLPILLLISVRFGPRGIFTSALFVAVVCIWYASKGYGPFIQKSIPHNVINLQIFIGIMSIPLLLLTSLIESHRRSEKHLRESEQKFRNLTESVRVWVWEVDRKCVYTYSSPKVKDFLGYEPEEIIGKKPFDFMLAEEAVRVSDTFSKCVASQEPFDDLENTNIKKNGDFVILESSGAPFFDGDGKLMGYRGIDRDITERKKTEQAIADSERRLADIIDFLPDPTWVINTEGIVIAWNRAMENVSGIGKEEIIGQGNFVYAIPFYGEQRPVLIDLALNRNEKWEKNYLKIKEKDGLLTEVESFHPSMGDGGCYFACTASRLYNAKGEVIGAIETLRDITHAKQLEQERENLIAELQEAIAKVQTLSGFLPICSSCKKIRDDNGYWNQIESYISKHSMAEFTHSICPKCVKKLYPDLKIDDY